MTLNEQADRLAKRKAELGFAGTQFVACNSGSRRSEEKRALLKMLADIREASPSALAFPAKF
jgi:hypothetical protein